MNEEKNDKEQKDVVTEALDEEEKEFTETLTEELKPIVKDPELKNEESEIGNEESEVKKAVETEDSIDAADFVTKEEFYGKENKAIKWIIFAVVAVICIIIGYFVIKFMNIKICSSKQSVVEQSVSNVASTTDDNGSNSESHPVAQYNNAYGALYFYSENNIITASKNLLTDVGNKKYLGMYNCESTNCGLYNKNNMTFNSSADNTVLISDKGKGIIYNYNSNTILTNAYNDWFAINVSSRTYLLANDSKSNIYGPNGNNITKNEYSDFGVVINSILYEQVDMYITAKKDGKWGIINVTNDNKVVDFKYDAIHIESKDVFTVEENNLWYAIKPNGDKLSTTGYKEIVKTDNNYMMVIKDNQFDIVDYTGESLIKIDIDAPKTYKRYDDNGNMIGITIKDEGNSILLITIVQANGTVLYRFNTNTLAIAKYSE